MNVGITYDLEALKRSCILYGQLSGKTESAVLTKQAPKLAWNIWRGLRELRPAKGSIRAERLAALARGGGIKIRDSVMEAVTGSKATQTAKGKKTFGKANLNLRQLAIKRELSVRESGVGFLAYATPRPQRQTLEAEQQVYERDVESRYHFALSQFSVHARESAETKFAQLRWLDVKAGQAQNATEGLNTSRAQQIIIEAIAETEQDINDYILRKQFEDVEKAGFL